MGSYGGLQIPRFHRSNLFLRRIANPPGRLAEDFSPGRLAEDFSLDALRKTFLWTPSGRLFSGRLAEDSFSGRLAEDFSLDA